jgi:hypothetical protein
LIENVSNPADAALGRFQRDSSNKAVDFVALTKQVFREITTILTRYAGNQYFLLHLRLLALIEAGGPFKH